MVEQRNMEGPITDDTNWLTADIVGMYPNMPIDMSNKGCREYLDGRTAITGQASTENIMKCQEIFQENNVFEFDGQLYTVYRQVSGSAIGEKQAPPVACHGRPSHSSPSFLRMAQSPTQCASTLARSSRTR